jgi:hydroxyethylthiazole kinase-like uncharacterized protein yjeF
MPTSAIPSVPILSLDDAGAMETALFGGDERKEWKAMAQAGRSVAKALLADFGELGAFPPAGRVLVLAGKGNNAGDALIAARELAEVHPRITVDVLFAFGARTLKPLAAKAWRGLSESGRGRVRSVDAHSLGASYDVCIDGIFGYQYRPPLPVEAAAAIGAAAARPLRLRAAVDLPTGLGEKGAFAADFTYATGSVKKPLLGCAHAGRPRYLDLGFFPAGHGRRADSGDRVLLSAVLGPLRELRAATSDKRSQGHLVLVGGTGFPGAVLMATLAALRSGVGLVTAFVPRSLVAAFAARAPEAMWMALPESSGGRLAPGGAERVLKVLERATALAVGPGLGRDPEALGLALDLAKASKVPLLLDADALQGDIVRAGAAPRIVTPHAGEFTRIAAGVGLRALARAVKGAVIRKGPVTEVSDGGAVYHSCFGGPVLSRGGSGDLLAGLAAGLLAQTPADPLLAACRAAAWHGMAADALARARGQTSVEVTQLLDFLAPVLRDSGWASDR